ncbi:MAG: bacteriohemerythrin [Terracidiphilus sp.]
MALLTWNDSYSVGVRTVDNQHSVLFSLINELHAAMETGQAKSMTGPILRKLLNYTRDHFAAEEAMMAASKYPGLAQHQIKHRDLTKQVEEFEARFERGEGTINIQLLGFLRDWLTNHIQHSDKEYSPWLKKSGMK